MRNSWNENTHLVLFLYKYPLLALGCALVSHLQGPLALAQSQGINRSPTQIQTPSRKPAQMVSPDSSSQKLDIESLKKQYWLNAPDMDLNVVQHRIYTKAWKLSLETMAGSFSGDPFVTTWAYGAKLGYYFGEYLGVHALYWKFSNSFNSAYSTLVSATAESAPPGYGSNSNEMQSLKGSEVTWSLLYGKLSLLGKAIIHFDLFLLAGAGILNANTGATKGEQNFSTFAYWPGIGQQFYFTPWLALRGDYRMMIYYEDVVERNTPSKIGTVSNNKQTFAPVFTVGLSILLF